MSELENLYICIDCELSGRASDPTRLNAHSLCPTCGSSSVVPVETFIELNERKSRAQVVADRPDARFQHQVKAMAEKRRRDSEPLRLWLTSHSSHLPGILDVLAKWDGWAWHVYYPWPFSPDLPTDNPSPTTFTIELINGVANGPKWIVTIDSKLLSVEPFQDGMI